MLTCDIFIQFYPLQRDSGYWSGPAHRYKESSRAPVKPVRAKTAVVNSHYFYYYLLSIIAVVILILIVYIYI